VITPPAQRPLQRDLGLEQLGDRAVLLGGPRQLLEFGAIDPRHLRLQRQGRLRHLEALTLLLQRHRAFGRKLARRDAGALKLEGERHGEAAGMRGGDQLLRVRAPLVLEARLEGIGGVVEDAGIGGEPAAAVLARACPDRSCLADHDASPSLGHGSIGERG
jgi:hypothetical protein